MSNISISSLMSLIVEAEAEAEAEADILRGSTKAIPSQHILVLAVSSPHPCRGGDSMRWECSSSSYRSNSYTTIYC